jgi:hypothetical protein
MLLPIIYNGATINDGVSKPQKDIVVPASTKKTSKNKPTTYSTYGNLGNYSGLSYKEGGSYSGYTPVKADISGVLAAYEQEANTQRDIAKKNYDLATGNINTAYDLGVKQARENYDLGASQAQKIYDSTISDATKARDSARSDLLQSIKRFREDNAENQLNQRKAYLNEQAQLEAAREQANRQNRIESSARGLGGSGLQQLAQMQNLLAQSEDVSQLANENQATLDKLRQALAREEEENAANLKKTDDAYNQALSKANLVKSNELDTLLNTRNSILDNLLNTKNTDLSNLLNNYNNTLSGIASALESQKESKIAENNRAYADAVNSARAAAASARANAKTTNYGVVLQNVLDTANVDLRKLANSSKVSTIKEYAAKAGLQLEDKQIKKDKEGIKQLIAKTIGDNVNDNILTAIDQYGLDQNTYGKMKNDINSMLDYYKFNPYY